jgi:twitching motility two-component system response regulator PilG
MTGMYMGEGRQLVGGEFAGFQVAGESLDVVDATGSLSTPFAGATPIGTFHPTRPPSSDLATPFGGYDSKDLSADAPASDSDFETIHPTNMPSSAESQAVTVDESPAAAKTPSYAEIAPPAAAAARAESPAAEEPGAPADNRPRKVLIVDDSPTVCKIVSITLKKRGFDVQSAGDGVEAMALVASDRPDLILLDITMPRMDGYQLCKLIKGYPETKNIPVIMLSGKDGFFDRVRGKLVGCSDYITKPFDPELLVAAVERFLPVPLAAAAT